MNMERSGKFGNLEYNFKDEDEAQRKCLKFDSSFLI